ncbi:hypothetical protein PUMCH_000140 [Australozyma saopauloensis]|uniref:DUF202 domain-containing protein n=1 Tax=Australozyma saopauloensis TaxID=291208 RepID=A0AAX4H4K1_9ASCO|nr:hypothetical protein PUMCH_000140 [[Candida] saopauloensis]
MSNQDASGYITPPIRLRTLSSAHLDPLIPNPGTSQNPLTFAQESILPTAQRTRAVRPDRGLQEQMFTIESTEDDHHEISEHTRLVSWLPPSTTLTCTLSEPRDLLQNERTCLSFSKFSVALFFCAFSVILGFSFTDKPTRPSPPNTILSKIVFSLLVFLALASLVVALISYFQTVRRLTQKRIHTIGSHKGLVMACFTAVVVALIAVNSLLIAERYRGGF